MTLPETGFSKLLVSGPNGSRSLPMVSIPAAVCCRFTTTERVKARRAGRRGALQVIARVMVLPLGLPMFNLQCLGQV